MGKLIAVWGSPGSGKTTFSVKLAEALYNRSRGKSAVIVVFTDIVTPTIPVIFPNFRSEDVFSVGTILSKPDFFADDVVSNMVIKGEKKRVWRCLNRVEHGTQYCKHSVSIDEEKLQEAICRGLRNAFEYQDEVSELILSGLSYAVTGDDNILDAYVIEQKIKDLKQDMEDMITMSMRTEGDTEKFEVEIRKISDQLCAMRSQLEVARSQTQASEKVNQEIDSIKAFLADTEINFLEYNEIVVRKLIECIRVMPDRKLVIVLKGGITIEEQIAE